MKNKNFSTNFASKEAALVEMKPGNKDGKIIATGDRKTLTEKKRQLEHKDSDKVKKLKEQIKNLQKSAKKYRIRKAVIEKEVKA